MTRVRTDNVFGTTTDNPLTSGATTMNSAGLANLAAVSSAEALIVLDPNRVSGAPEIVVVTAHTGSATSATIQRGQFGTTARQHASGTQWVHGPIASNASTYATAADDQGDFVAMNAWEAWTPTTANLTLGNGTLTTAYVRMGRTIHWSFKFTLGSTSAVGTLPTFTLPVAGTGVMTGGAAVGTDTGNGIYGLIMRETGAGTTLGFYRTSGVTATLDTPVSATVPHTWGSTDVIEAAGFYQAAS